MKGHGYEMKGKCMQMAGRWKDMNAHWNENERNMKGKWREMKNTHVRGMKENDRRRMQHERNMHANDGKMKEHARKWMQNERNMKCCAKHLIPTKQLLDQFRACLGIDFGFLLDLEYADFHKTLESDNHNNSN